MNDSLNEYLFNPEEEKLIVNLLRIQRMYLQYIQEDPDQVNLIDEILKRMV